MKQPQFLILAMFFFCSSLAAAVPALANADDFHRQNLAACRAGDPRMVPLCACVEDRLRGMGINDFSGTYNSRKARYDSAVSVCASQHLTEARNAQTAEQHNQPVPGAVQWTVTLNQTAVPMSSAPTAAANFSVGDAQCTLGPAQEQQLTEKDGVTNIYEIRVLVCTNAIVSVPSGGSALICYHSPDGQRVGVKQSSFRLDDATGKQIASGSVHCQFVPQN